MSAIGENLIAVRASVVASYCSSNKFCKEWLSQRTHQCTVQCIENEQLGKGDENCR